MNKTKVSISEAIKMANVSRSHFYKKYINTGAISIETTDDKKLIDVSELIRVFGNIQIENNSDTIQNTTENNSNIYEKSKFIDLLEQQIAELKTSAKAAQEREDWLKSQIDELRKQQSYFLEDKTPKKRKKFLGIL